MTVFLCHAAEDKARVRVLNSNLIALGFETWLDEERLLPGQNWESEITRSIRLASAVLVCLSRTSVSKTGFVQKELRFALDVALEMPQDEIYIIPCLFEPIALPKALRHWHALDLQSTELKEVRLKCSM